MISLSLCLALPSSRQTSFIFSRFFFPPSSASATSPETKRTLEARAPSAREKSPQGQEKSPGPQKEEKFFSILCRALSPLLFFVSSVALSPMGDRGGGRGRGRGRGGGGAAPPPPPALLLLRRGGSSSAGASLGASAASVAAPRPVNLPSMKKVKEREMRGRFDQLSFRFPLSHDSRLQNPL